MSATIRSDPEDRPQRDPSETKAAMRVYVINLARSPERRAHITAQLANTGLDYEIITGVDGLSLDLADCDIAHPSVISGNRLPAGAVGCAMSHIRAYQKVLSDGANAALILEDDVNLPADLGVLIDTVAKHLTGAEVALLNYQTDEPCQLSSRGAITLPSAQLLALPIDVVELTSAAGYVITRSACERMTRSAPPIRANADDWQYFYKEELLDRVRVIWPQAIAKNPNLASTIGSYSLGNSMRARLVARLMHRNIPILRQLVIYRRYRIFQTRNQAKLVESPFINKPSRLDA